MTEMDEVLSQSFPGTLMGLTCDLNQYMLKLVLDSGAQLPDPYTLPDQEWTNGASNRPEITLRDATTYLIDT